MASFIKNKWFYISLALLLAGSAVSLFGGNASVSAETLLKAAMHPEEAPAAAVLILYRIRIPRLLAGIVCGAALAVSGLLLQEALRNPLASPGIMGIHNGAGFFALLSALFFGPFSVARSCMAFLGAVCSMALVWAIGSFAGSRRSTLLLAGVAVSSVMSACINLLITLRPDSVADKAAFQLGSLHSIQPSTLLMTAILVLPGIAGALGLSRGISLFALGDEAAHGLGLAVRRHRLLTILCSTLLSAAAVSACGLISFVGLIIPNLIRKLSRESTAERIVLCMVFGAGFLVCCDLAARSVAYPYELPVGTLLSLLGAPFFIFLLVRRRRWEH